MTILTQQRGFVFDQRPKESRSLTETLHLQVCPLSRVLEGVVIEPLIDRDLFEDCRSALASSRKHKFHGRQPLLQVCRAEKLAAEAFGIAAASMENNPSVGMLLFSQGRDGQRNWIGPI